MNEPAPSDSPTTPLDAHAALAIVALLFGANYVAAKVALREVSPLGLVQIRTWATAAILFGGSLLTDRPSAAHRLDTRDLRHLFFYSLLGISVNQVCFLEGLARSTATNASIILVSIPLLTLAFAVLLGRERASLTGVLGIGIGLVGALLLIVPRGGVDFTSRAAIGNLFLLGSASSYGLYLVLTRPILARHDPLRVVSWIFLLAAVTVSLVGWRELRQLSLSGISGAGWASIAYVSIGGTALPYLLNNWALVRVKSSLVAVYILLQPIVAGSLGHFLLGERFGPHTAVAAVLIVAGVMLSARRHG